MSSTSYLSAFNQTVEGLSVLPPEIDIRTSLLAAELNKLFTFSPIAKNSPTYWTATGLPPGITIDAATGKLEGTPSSQGLYRVLLAASNFEIVNVSSFSGANINFSSHNFVSGDVVAVCSSGALPSPLSASSLYRAQVIDSDTIQLYTLAGVVVSTLSGGSGTWSVVKRRTDEVALLLPVCGLSEVSTTQDNITLLMNMDIDSGIITFPTISVGQWSPPTVQQRQVGLSAPKYMVNRGDRFPVSIAFTRDGEPQDLGISSLLLGSKQFEPDPLIGLTDKAFKKVGSGRQARYEVVLEVSERLWTGVLSDEEEDDGTYVDSHCELQFKIGGIFYEAINLLEVHDPQTLEPELANSFAEQGFTFRGLPNNVQGTIPFTLLLELDVLNSGGAMSASITKPLLGALSDDVWTFVDRDQEGLEDQVITNTTSTNTGTVTMTLDKYRFTSGTNTLTSEEAGHADSPVSLVPGKTIGTETVDVLGPGGTVLESNEVGMYQWAPVFNIPVSTSYTGSRYVLTSNKTLTFTNSLGQSMGSCLLTAGMDAQSGNFISPIGRAIHDIGQFYLYFPKVSLTNGNLRIEFSHSRTSFQFNNEARTCSGVTASYPAQSSFGQNYTVEDLVEACAYGVEREIQGYGNGGRIISWTATGNQITFVFNMKGTETIEDIRTEEGTYEFVTDTTTETTTRVIPFTPQNISDETAEVNDWSALLSFISMEGVSDTQARLSSRVDVEETWAAAYYGDEAPDGTIQVRATLSAAGSVGTGGYTKTSETFILRVKRDLIQEGNESNL